MKIYSLILAPVALACLAYGQDNPVKTVDTPKEAQKIDPDQTTYTPKPGETVVKWTFKTPEGLLSERGCGDVYMVFDFKNTPNTSAHIVHLVKTGFYTGIKVHRVETRSDFALVQFGNAGTKDPKWDKQSEVGSGKAVNRELGPENHHALGSVGLARTQDPNSGDCQLYVCLVPIQRLDKDYSVFAQVVAGLGVMKYVKVDSEIVSATVLQEGDDAKALLATLPADNAAAPVDPVQKFADPDGKLHWVTSNNGLKIAEIASGDGKAAANGNKVKVKYSGWLPDGKPPFDAGSIDFELGAGRVIKGWDQGLLGLKVGGKRKLIIPPSLAYGDRGAGEVIPPGATLIFDVELLEIN